jgi:hypothetical protein
MHNVLGGGGSVYYYNNGPDTPNLTYLDITYTWNLENLGSNPVGSVVSGGAGCPSTASPTSLLGLIRAFWIF